LSPEIRLTEPNTIHILLIEPTGASVQNKIGFEPLFIEVVLLDDAPLEVKVLMA
jgi:hypothetical protein